MFVAGRTEFMSSETSMLVSVFIDHNLSLHSARVNILFCNNESCACLCDATATAFLFWQQQNAAQTPETRGLWATCCATALEASTSHDAVAEESEGIKKHPTVVFDNLNFLNVTKVSCFKFTKSNY